MNHLFSSASFSRFRLSRVVLVTGLLFTFVLSGRAQAPGSSRGLASGDGIHNIQGRVHFPSGQAVNSKPVKVSLESVASFGAMSTVTDQDGVFRFKNLLAGDYTIVVDAGKEYETARESVNIYREASPGGRTIQVAIQLRLRVDSSNPAFANIPGESLSLFQKGIAAAKKGNSKAAVESLNKAVSIYPNFPIALSELGLQYMKLGQMDKAGETFETLLKLKPADSGAEVNLGIVLFNKKSFDEAEKHLRQAIKLDHAGPTAHYYLGLTLISLKAFDEAEKEFQLAINNGGENLAPAHKYLGGLYMRAKKNKEAADELDKYLKLDPNAADAERIKGTIKDLRSKQ